MDNQSLNRERLINAIDAFKDGHPSAIVDAVSVLTESEKMVVKLVQELTTDPPKPPRARRSDAGTKRNKAVADISKAS
jgi:hypothetical protein